MLIRYWYDVIEHYLIQKFWHSFEVFIQKNIDRHIYV